MERYWLRINRLEWQEVTREQFIKAERSVGFYSKDGYGKLATAGFSSSTIGGKITNEDVVQENLEKR